MPGHAAGARRAEVEVHDGDVVWGILYTSGPSVRAMKLISSAPSVVAVLSRLVSDTLALAPRESRQVAKPINELPGIASDSCYLT
jgi:hypothetical protein